MNAVTAVKALARGRPSLAQDLLLRGLARVGTSTDETNPVQRLDALLDGVLQCDPGLADLVRKVRALIAEFGTGVD